MPKRKVRKPPKKTGRPTLYNPDEHPKAARLLTGNGKTLADLAEHFGVSCFTISEWRTVHAEFSAAIDLGKQDATAAVERALFQRATGYSHPAVKILAVSGGQGMGSSVEQVPYTEHYPPDTEAAKFWLKNRKPAEWRDKQEVEHSGTLLEQLVGESMGAEIEKAKP
jgi:transposase-like protein